MTVAVNVFHLELPIQLLGELALSIFEKQSWLICKAKRTNDNLLTGNQILGYNKGETQASILPASLVENKNLGRSEIDVVNCS